MGPARHFFFHDVTVHELTLDVLVERDPVLDRELGRQWYRDGHGATIAQLGDDAATTSDGRHHRRRASQPPLYRFHPTPLRSHALPGVTIAASPEGAIVRPDGHDRRQARPRRGIRGPDDAPKNFIAELVEDDLRTGKHPQVITRFPPEPNGYLHIGVQSHDRAARQLGQAGEEGVIRSLRLRDFKSFRDVEVPLGPFTVVVGTNASGKSNKLEPLFAAHHTGDAKAVFDAWERAKRALLHPARPFRALAHDVLAVLVSGELREGYTLHLDHPA